MGGAGKVIFGSDFGIADWPLLAERIDDVCFAGLSDAELRRSCTTTPRTCCTSMSGRCPGDHEGGSRT